MTDYGYQPKHAGGFDRHPDLEHRGYQPRHASGLVRIRHTGHGIDHGNWPFVAPPRSLR